MYLLGLDLLNQHIDYTHLDSHIKQLSTMGAEKYLEHIKSKNQITESVNSTNCLGEDVNDYSPFDRLEWADNGHKFVFTRDEFDNLKNRKINPYTNVNMSMILHYNINMRLSIAKHENLPNPQPLSEHYSELEIEEEYVPEESDEDEEKVLEEFIGDGGFGHLLSQIFL